MGNVKSTTETSANTTIPTTAANSMVTTSVPTANPTTPAFVTVATKPASTSAEIRKCYLCGQEMPKHLLGQHNKEVHKVLRFEWINGAPNIISKPVTRMSSSNQQTVEHSVANVPLLPVPMFLASSPPMPNSPAPVIPKQPSEPQPDSNKTSLNSEVKSAKAKMVPIDCLEDTNAYDMDISAESETDSDNFVEGNLFDTSKVPAAK